MLSGKPLTQTSSQEDSFKQLEKISTDKQIRETKSGTWATGHGINEELEKLLGDRVHIVHPDTSSISSPVSCDVNSSFEGAINYAKMIGGYCVNEELIANGFIHMDGGELKKPIVMVINTDTAVVKDEKDANKIGGVHWQTCVILPKNYISISGNQLGNKQEIMFYIDSLYPNTKIPIKLMKLLKEGGEDKGRNHQLLPIFPNAQVIDGLDTKQQQGGEDCGWWALYDALMLVYTGTMEYLNQFKAPSRDIAYKLRSIFPDLVEEAQIGTSKAKIDSRLEARTPISSFNFGRNKSDKSKKRILLN